MMFLYIRHSSFLHQLWGVDYYSLYVKMMGIYHIFQPCGELPLPQSLSWQRTYYKEDSLHFFIEANFFSYPHQ